MADALRQIDIDLWAADGPLRYVVEMGRRMTVVRLAGDDLLLHSPAPLQPALAEGLADLGKVRFVVAASNLHGHGSMADYQAAYPDAELFSAPGLAAKRPDLRFAAELGEHADPRWGDALHQLVFRGHRLLEEIVFLHRPSRTLIVGDVCFNIGPDAPLSTRLWAWGPRLRRRGGPALPFRAGVRDKQAARDSVKRILEWDFDRIIVGHGEIVESGGRELFQEGWRWVE